MQTRLKTFCSEFDKIIRPLLGPVEHVVQHLGDGSGSKPVYGGLPDLREGHHRLNLLIEKIAQQQAYVLIFGPLKSGKSTLMNAITAAYVSEVTALPAYPCLVYVSHSERPQYTITRYDGTSESLQTSAELHRQFSDAHQELAEQIRSFEQSQSRRDATAAAPGSPPSFADGADDHFDPAIHYPRAIRKVDVKVPAGDLEQSAAVLVDTPGLYCRMKFGYDQMTRDFRDTAACAVFVVKTDNLFLEQVFEEFQELLEIFGRIALVVNLDSTKCDLGPDGSLIPSLERENPQRIIEAFESLAMSAPLKAALDSGRLRIYPVDLLRAASERLSSAQPTKRPSASVTARASEIVHTGFEAFRRDTTEYLNSNEYFDSFRIDSARYARNLFKKLGSCSENEDVLAIQRQAEQLKIVIEEGKRMEAAIQRVNTRDWSGSFATARQEMGSRFEEVSRQIIRAELQASVKAIDEWFGSEHSLEDLTKVTLARMTTRAQERMAGAVTKAFAELVSQHNSDENAKGTATSEVRGGFALDQTTTADLSRAGVELAPLIRKAASSLEPRTHVSPLVHEFPYDLIPVRKGLGDWLLFRSKNSLRNRMFGGKGHPNRPIPVAAKKKNLSSAGRIFLVSSVENFLKDKLPQRLQQMYRSTIDQYLQTFTDPLVGHCRERTAENAAQMARDEERLVQLSSIADAFTSLATRLEASERLLDELQKPFEKSESISGDTSPIVEAG